VTRIPGDKAPAWLDCDHCGDVAIYSDPEGLFTDGDGECVSCGFPGWVTADTDICAEWRTSDDADSRCNDPECDECSEMER
jgi:hypothetical protein